MPLGLTLGKKTEVADLRTREERRGGIGTSRNARTASDARRRIHGEIGVSLWNRKRISVLSAARRDADVSTARDDAIECAAVNHEVLHNWKSPGAPWLDVKHVTF